MPDNPDGQIDTATSSEGPPIPAALAADREHESGWEDGPWPVTGVALAEDDVTEGVSGKRVYWPRETLESATDALEGRHIVDDREHDDLETTQPATETIIGEVTETKYEPGTGILFHGEVDDPETAKQIERGRVDPSPMLFRRVGEYDDDRDAHTATSIEHWRDLSVVADGASAGASIQPGAASALQADALRAAFADGAGGGEGSSDEQSSDEPAEPGTDADGDSNSDTMDLTDTEEDLVRAARSTDDPAVVPAETQALAQTADELHINDYDDPMVVETDEHEQHEDSMTLIDNLLTDKLAEREDTKASEAAAMSFDAKLGEFEDDDGDLDADALTQSPEAGSAGDGEEDADGTVSGDALSDGDRDEVRALAKRAETFDSIDTEHAESLREEAADVADAEEFDDIELEAL